MLKKIFIYGVGTFFSKILVFLLLPIYTRVLSPSDYGYYDVLLANVQLLVSIAFMEIWSGIIRFMYDDEDVYGPVKTFLSLFPFFIVIYVVVYFLFSHFFLVKFPVVAFCFGITYLLFNVLNSICRGLGRNVDYVVSSAVSTVVSCLLNLVLIVWLRKGIACMFISLGLGYICGVLYVEIQTKALRIAFKRKSSVDKKKELVLYCFPLVVNTVSYSFLPLFNKNIIIRFLGEEVSGYYAIAEKVTVILSLAISIYHLAWQEEAFSVAKRENRSEIYSYYTNQFIRCVGLLIPGYLLFCHFLMPLVSGENFASALELIPLFVIQAYIANMSSFFCVIISAHKKSIQILLSTIFGAIINGILIILLMPRIGVLASNVSLCIGFGVCAFARYVFACQFAKLKINLIWFFAVIFEFCLSFFVFKTGSTVAIFIFMVAVFSIWIFANYQMIKEYVLKSIGIWMNTK